MNLLISLKTIEINPWKTVDVLVNSKGITMYSK